MNLGHISNESSAQAAHQRSIHFIFRQEGWNSEFLGGDLPGYLQYNNKNVQTPSPRGGLISSWTVTKCPLVIVTRPMDPVTFDMRQLSCLDVCDDC